MECDGCEPYGEEVEYSGAEMEYSGAEVEYSEDMECEDYDLYEGDGKYYGYSRWWMPGRKRRIIYTGNLSGAEPCLEVTGVCSGLVPIYIL